MGLANMQEAIGDKKIFRIFEAARKRHEAMTSEERAELAAQRDRDERIWVREGMRRHQREKCGLEGAMFERTLDSFQAKSDSQAEALNFAREFVRRYPGSKEKPTRRGLFLWGEPGRGKSCIMQGLILALLEKPRVYDLLYIPCAEIGRIDRYLDIEHAASEADVVVLDDIEKALDDPGCKYKSKPDGIVRRIVNKADRARSTIICATSNYSIADHAKRSSAFGSRLAGLMVECQVEGPDMRPNADAEHEEIWWAR